MSDDFSNQENRPLKQAARSIQERKHARHSIAWTELKDQFAASRIASAEQRVGKPVQSVDRYWGPDGVSGGLCTCWFYFDDQGRVLDAEWQYHTD